MNQAELAERSGISKSQLSRYLAGKATPQLRQIHRLVDALEVRDLTFWYTVSELQSLERVLAARAGSGWPDPLLEAVLRSLLGEPRDDAAGEAAAAGGGRLGRLLAAARRSNAANRAILEALTEEHAAGRAAALGD